MTVQDLYLFIAVFDDEKAAEPVAKAVGEAAKANKVNIDGLAAVHRDTHGHVHLHEIGDITGSQGAVRGAAVGAIIGLIFPPAVLGSTILGGAIASVVAKFHDTGFATKELHALGESLGKGESAVVFVGDATTEQALSSELETAKTVKKEPAPEELKSEVQTAAATEGAAATDPAANAPAADEGTDATGARPADAP
jgi:uncharacterized membrane protein